MRSELKKRKVLATTKREQYRQKILDKAKKQLGSRILDQLAGLGKALKKLEKN